MENRFCVFNYDVPSEKATTTHSTRNANAINNKQEEKYKGQNRKRSPNKKGAKKKRIGASPTLKVIVN